MRGNRLGLLTAGVALAAAGCQAREGAPDDGSRPAAMVEGVDARLLLAAAAVALPPPGIAPADLPDAQSEGALHLAFFCAQCHHLPSPALHSATDWPGVARRMWLRMDLLPPGFGVKLPTMQQRQAMLNYLVENALKVSGSVLPAGAGRAAFSEVCDRCHALPDPRQHSPADWPTVILRMEQRMDQLRVNRPTPEATREILGYLSRVSGRR